MCPTWYIYWLVYFRVTTKISLQVHTFNCQIIFHSFDRCISAFTVKPGNTSVKASYQSSFSSSAVENPKSKLKVDNDMYHTFQICEYPIYISLTLSLWVLLIPIHLKNITYRLFLQSFSEFLQS